VAQSRQLRYGRRETEDKTTSDSRLSLLCSSAVLALALLVSGCGDHERGKDDVEVSWTRVVTLVRDCEAKRVDQTHSRLVTVTLRDGRRALAREPRIDAIIPVVNHAAHRCGPITFATE
jgi:hypothetical protein